MQSKKMSLIEAIVNVIFGYCVAVISQAMIFPYFGLYTSFEQNMKIGLIFTFISLIRSYIIRRVFNSIQ